MKKLISAVIKFPHILIWLIKFGGMICKWIFYSTVASNEHQDTCINLPLDCLLSSLFRLISKKTSKLLIFGILWSPVDSPHKRPVIRKAFPRHDTVISQKRGISCTYCKIRWVQKCYRWWVYFKCQEFEIFSYVTIYNLINCKLFLFFAFIGGHSGSVT